MAELTEVDVEALVRDARAGDRHALGRLYDIYRDRVARFATGRLGDVEKRSEERRVGKECGYQCRSRWSPYH